MEIYNFKIQKQKYNKEEKNIKKNMVHLKKNKKKNNKCLINFNNLYKKQITLKLRNKNIQKNQNKNKNYRKHKIN